MLFKLIAQHIKNVGPFVEDVNLIFSSGKYLIKAPIGTGKSFLFFDSPFFALYKKNGRNLLNVNSKNGIIELIFAKEDQLFLIRRDLTKTASSFSTKSRLFELSHISGNGLSQLVSRINSFEEPVVFGGNVIEDITKDPQRQINEISFKNDTEIQSNLDALLPSEGLFLHTHCLMQDSDNIFVLPPADRIKLLKETFSLMDLDFYKDKLGEKKREIQTSIKIKSDMDEINKTMHDFLTKIIEYDQKLSDISTDYKEFRGKFAEQFQIISSNLDKLAINDFSIDAEIPNFINSLEEDSQKKIIETTELITQKKHVEDQINFFKQNILKLENNIKNLEDEVDKIQKILGETKQDSELGDLINKKNLILKNIEDINKQVDFKQFSKFGFNGNNISELLNFSESVGQKGKIIKGEIETIQQKIENTNQQEKILIDQLNDLDFDKNGTKSYRDLETQKNNLLEKIGYETQKIQTQNESLNKEKNNIIIQINNIKTLLDNQKAQKDGLTKFECSKINDLCPFLEQINSSAIKNADKQLEISKLEYDRLQKNYEKIESDIKSEGSEEKIANLNRELELAKSNKHPIILDWINEKNILKQAIQKELVDKNFENIKLEYTQQIKKLELEIEQLRNVFSNIKNLNLTEKNENIKNHENDIKSIELQILENEKNITNSQKLQNDLHSKKNEIDITNKNILENNSLLESEQKKISEINTKISEYDSEKITRIIILTKDFKKNLDGLDGLIERYRKISIELQVLKEEERKYGELYSVFSKELPYFIFEQFLPVLMNLINGYLSICSDLELIHEISSKDGEKIEMNVFIKDHLGKRDVKSLSGGQKTLLKLVWILAVSKYSSTDFLFLDETINNIDHETIGRVAQMLESYVRENGISLYVVTHSQQIQSMDIRDKTLTPQK